jgi:integrase
LALTRAADPWEAAARKQVRALGTGFTVLSMRGQVQLKLRVPDQPIQSVVLPFTWTENAWGDCYVRIRNIYALVQEHGYTLKQAAEVAAGKAPKLVEQQDWPGAVDRFKEQKLRHGTAIKPDTWDAKYQPVLTDAIAELTGRKPPTTPAELIDRCIRNPKWPPGSRTRQERARNLCQFLRHAVTREQMPAIWQPPLDLKDHIGRKPATATSQKADPITDQQIINLLASLPEDSAGRRWGDVIKLMAELGLRPIELLHLSVKRDPKTKIDFWHCSYQKRAGGGVTEPRRLYPLALVDEQGQAQAWDLLERWKAKGIELPSLRAGNGASDAISTYLNRQTGWQDLKAELEAKGERLACYSFRHSYSVRGHQRGIDNGSMALAMGHSIEVHCRSYPWASEVGTEAAFKRASIN